MGVPENLTYLKVYFGLSEEVLRRADVVAPMCSFDCLYAQSCIGRAVRLVWHVDPAFLQFEPPDEGGGVATPSTDQVHGLPQGDFHGIRGRCIYDFGHGQFFKRR